HDGPRGAAGARVRGAARAADRLQARVVSPALLAPADPRRGASQRVLLLPPAYSGAGDFLREGFAEAVRARRLDLDLVLIELRLQCLSRRSALAERARLITAARSSGCVTLWLGGISLGAFIALACAERHCRELDGLCLFAPYLGSLIV